MYAHVYILVAEQFNNPTDKLNYYKETNFETNTILQQNY